MTYTATNQCSGISARPKIFCNYLELTNMMVFLSIEQTPLTSGNVLISKN